MIPFNYHHLYYFFVIAKAGSISKACQMLLLAQSTVSAQLKQFETFLGYSLFERRNQRLHLTEEGRTVLDYAERIYEMGQEFLDSLRDKPSPDRWSIQIGVLNGTPRSFAHALVSAILVHAPNTHVVVREGELELLLGEIREHRLDLILSDVAVSSSEQGEYTNHLVGKSRINFVAVPHIARQCRRFPEGLHGAPLILPLAPSHVFQQIQVFFTARKIIPRIVAQVQDIELARRLAISGFGIAPLNAFTVSVSQPAGHLRVIGSPPLQAVYEPLYLVARKRKWPNPMAEYLVKTFRIPTKAASKVKPRSVR